MRHRRKKHPYANEAANPETTPVRLAELAQERELKPIIAANPNTPSNLLQAFALDPNGAVRRATAQNPNTPLPQLLKLIEEFPHEFLRNPILPLLNLAQPDFIKKAQPKAWLQLLRCEEIPQHWIQWFQQDSFVSRSNIKEYLIRSCKAHIRVAGELENTQDPQTIRLDLLLPREQLGNSSYGAGHFLIGNVLPDLVNHWLRQGEFHTNPDTIVSLIHSCPNIDEDILRDLAQHQQAKVREAVARHLNTPEEVLQQLLQDQEPQVQYSLASRRKLPQALLKHLISSNNPRLRRAAALHPQLEIPVLEALAQDPDVTVRRATASRHGLAEHIYSLLAHDSDKIVRQTVAGRHGIAEHIYSLLAQDTKMIIRKIVAARHGLSTELYSRLAQDGSHQVRMALACNVKAPQHILLSLARDEKAIVRQTVAHNPTLPQEAFFLLAEEANSDIQVQLAGNSQLPRELFERFMHHSEPFVLEKLAGNPRIPLDILEHIRIINPHIPPTHPRRSPQTSLELLDAIINQDNVRGRFYRGLQPYQIQDILQKSVVSKQKRIQVLHDYFLHILQFSINDPLRMKLLGYEKLPIQFLYGFARSPIPVERYQSAQHPNASMALLKELAQDANRYVRAAARQQLALRDEKK
ncbi:HEAT repeat domain-containing protein [Ktedonobacter robiniae]|uniref:Leucine rich repeat variant domain-containing protein n=1 Tax=Ktedonobacter robiniae TaxID=2778365 RepID=A0ABQ3UGM6_9CHLR|nr:HEAT repeat domain-containing protein [Ktedonobacter robiniae]GHO51597.1 hypothetical protein KSB_00720 [Ktedonobacter robiniae]